MQSSGLGVLKLTLFFLVVLFVVFVGGVLVAAVSLPILLAFPTVRRQFVAFTEDVGGTRVESTLDWRFVGVYVLFVEIYGLALIVVAATLAEWVERYGRFVSTGTVDPLLALVVVALVGLGVAVAARRVASREQLRVVGEWTAFLCLLAGLALVVAVVVPWLLFDLIGALLW
ncbi:MULTISPECIES: hypothetical protein [Halorussus]|uniref:hypothetical protein n=1 Tax=Halorussus TaxID=1070314 RepID=UPI00209D59C3|nr:hypothetical protein [Halorussus vallis]USZ77603.1 hypothetical protein NGM07_09760 [Halorussus vallis]